MGHAVLVSEAGTLSLRTVAPFPWLEGFWCCVLTDTGAPSSCPLRAALCVSGPVGQLTEKTCALHLKNK